MAENTTTQIIQVVIAIIRNQDQVLMVHQQGLEDPEPYWVLPGGAVEPGELLTEALIREAAEEAGIQITTVGALAYCTQIDRPESQAQTIAFAFEVHVWTGTPAPSDPDSEILSAAWVPCSDAINRIPIWAWRGMREPLLAYLQAKQPPGAVWLYRETAGEQTPIACLAPHI